MFHLKNLACKGLIYLIVPWPVCVVLLQDARVWIPDAEVVWKSAVLLQDYKGQKEIDIQYEDGDVSTHRGLNAKEM